MSDTAPLFLTRKDNWQQIFVEFLQESQNEGVVCDWEFFNCTSWVCDGIEAITGVDLYAPYRGRSNSIASAWRMIKEAGFKSLDDIIASQLPEIPVAFAQRGDMVLVPVPAMQLPIMTAARSGTDLSAQTFSDVGMPHAVCLADPPIFYNLTEVGITREPLTMATRAFRVGV